MLLRIAYGSLLKILLWNKPHLLNSGCPFIFPRHFQAILIHLFTFLLNTSQGNPCFNCRRHRENVEMVFLKSCVEPERREE